MFWNVYDGILLTLLALCVVVWPTQLISDRTNRRLRMAAVVLVFVQLFVNGPRPQLVTTYLVAALFMVLLSVDRRNSGEPSAIRESKEGLKKKLVRWTLVVGTGFAVLISIIFCLVFPRFEYPAPGGKYAIAAKSIRLTDKSRPERYTESSDDDREISVRITYPAQAAEQLKSDKAHSDAAGILSLILRSSTTLTWGGIRTHAKMEAPVSDAQPKYPVLIFSHGFPTGYPEQNTVLIEHLASHGYVVLAINHAWQSLYYEYEDGTLANLSVLTKLEKSLGDPQSEVGRREEIALWTQLADAKDRPIDEQVALVRKAAAADPRAQKFNAITHGIISDDQRFVIDCLTALQASDPQLVGRLDLERIGVLGHSSGGTAAQMTCAADLRCKAALNMDGFQPLLVDLPPLKTPFMRMTGKDSPSSKISYEQAQATSYFVFINGASHLDFTDAMLSMGFMKRLGLLGHIDRDRMYAIINAYALAFFDTHLLGQADPLLKRVPSEYPEVTFTAK